MTPRLRTFLVTLPAMGGLVVLTSCSSEPSPSTEPALVVGHGWAASLDDGEVGVFGMVMNATDSEVAIIGATSESSAGAELRENGDDSRKSTTEGAPVAQLVVPGGQPINMGPDAEHVVLTGLSEEAMASEDFQVTLLLEDGSEVSFRAPVEDLEDDSEDL